MNERHRRQRRGRDHEPLAEVGCSRDAGRACAVRAARRRCASAAAGPAVHRPAAADVRAARAVIGPHIAASSVGSLPAAAHVGGAYVLRGTLLNDGTAVASAPVVVHLLRPGVMPVAIGSTAVTLAAHSSRDYSVHVRLPRVLRNGSYALAACARLSCVTTERHLQVGPRPRAVRVPAAAPARGCSSGAHSLSPFGAHVYPETGNGGYTSVHSDVYLSYDTEANLFLPGTRVVLTDVATQCLSDFSLDFERTSANTTDGPDLSVGSVLVNGAPASFTFAQPTYPGDPNGQNDPDPRAHEAGELAPVGGPEGNPFPPACTPELPTFTRTSSSISTARSARPTSW